ncbi:MAG: DUF3800 domain-containing protein [candidate division WWE3 bacterium]|nr:DUF3800 domain-containing protein [candidate division WWE3 bacterium]
MVVFIDESGTHKQEGHTTTAVVYVQVINKEKFEADLTQIERDLRIAYFHWAEERWFMREKFLNKISGLDFVVKVAVFKNPAHPQAMIEAVFKQLITEPIVRTIVIDGKKPRWYEQKLKKVLRDRGIEVWRLKTVRSTGNVGIQLADSIAGLVRYCYDKPNEELAQSLLKKLQKKQRIAGIYLLQSALESVSK